MPALSPEVSELLRAIKQAVKPSETDSERVLETLRERLGNLECDPSTDSKLGRTTTNLTSDVIELRRPRRRFVSR
jgi:hypothetical protein